MTWESPKTWTLKLSLSLAAFFGSNSRLARSRLPAVSPFAVAAVERTAAVS